MQKNQSLKIQEQITQSEICIPQSEIKHTTYNILFIPRKKLLLRHNLNRGALIIRAEIKPIEPDTGNAGEGMDKL